MIVSDKVMDALKSIGLNLYERRIWVALLAKGTASAGELAGISNVPRSRSYDILKGLAEKGFAIIQPGKPLKFIAIKPSEALERAKRKIEEEMKILQSKIDEIKESAIMKELNEIYEKGFKLVQPEEITGTIKGRALVHQQFQTMVKDAKKKINIIFAPETLNEIFSKHFELLREAKEKGVEIKIATAENEKYMDFLKALMEIADIRILDKKALPIHGNLALIDEKELLFGLTDPAAHATQDIAIWTKSEHATSHLLGPLFNLIWEKAKPLK